MRKLEEKAGPRLERAQIKDRKEPTASSLLVITGGDATLLAALVCICLRASCCVKWKAEDTPSDRLSMQNGQIILSARQTPFIIDPNTQAAEWLKERVEDQSLEVVLQQDPRFVASLELSVRRGKPLVIQEVDGALPILYRSCGAICFDKARAGSSEWAPRPSTTTAGSACSS